VAAPYPGGTRPTVVVCCVTRCRVAQWRAGVTLPGPHRTAPRCPGPPPLPHNG